jgi:CRP-like cAMP-binding protein
MDTRNILSSISRHAMLGDAEEQYFVSLLLPVQVRHHELVEKAGEVTKYFIHVNSGCLMTYYTNPEGHDQVIQFPVAGWWTGDLHSMSTQEPSIYSTRALADSEVFLLPRDKFDSLLKQFPVFERYFRIIFQNSLVTQQQRIIQAFSYTAEQRYEFFIKKYPNLEQFVPQKYIASYLGITPEFLSKIRRKQLNRE